MAKLRHQYDMMNGPLWLMSDDPTSPPSHVAPDANILQIGTSTYPAYSNSGGKMVEMRAKYDSSASGDMRGMYLRVEAYGNPGAGCCVSTIRAMTSVNEPISNAYGANISLMFADTDGAVSGEGRALKATLHLADGIAPTGTLSAMQAVIYSDGAASDPAGATKISFIEINNGGHADGRADVDDDAFLFSLTGFTAGNEASGHMIQNTITAATMNAACTMAAKINIGGTTYYIPIATAVE